MYASKAGLYPLKNRATRRRLVAMDIENVNGGAVGSRSLADAAYNEVAEAIALRDDEQIVIGVGPSSLLAVGQSQPRSRLVMGRGLDGADHALLAVLGGESLASRFDEIVIVSGDGIFTEVAAWLAREGAHVTVVARECKLARRLKFAAGAVVLLADHAVNFEEAA